MGLMVCSHWLGPEPRLGQGQGPGRMGCMVLIRTFHTAPEQGQRRTPGIFSGPEEWVWYPFFRSWKCALWWILVFFPVPVQVQCERFLLKHTTHSSRSLAMWKVLHNTGPSPCPGETFSLPPLSMPRQVYHNDKGIMISPSQGILKPFYEPLLVMTNQPLYLWWIIGIAILNRISRMVTDEFLQTTLLLKPFIFTDNLCTL